MLEASQPKQKETRQARKAEILKRKGSWQKNADSTLENGSLKLMLLTQFQRPSRERKRDLNRGLGGQWFIH